MKTFSYFLFENFDADLESENPDNPRRIISTQADAILVRVAEFAPQTCSVTRLRDEFGKEAVSRLIAAGVFREQDGQIAYDTPIFLEEDVPVLKAFSATAAIPLADRLWNLRDKLWDTVGGINNSFSPQVNLYHILCGMIFDGFFFDYLGKRGVVATSRLHPSGLDYLSVIYEDCPELTQFSNGLLCSYNRLTDGLFGYVKDGDICVPVFNQTDEPIITDLAELIKENLYDAVVCTLQNIQTNLVITATRHGVPASEIANELYHILFGAINEELVKRGLTAAPPHKPGEGRYLQCIEW